MTAERYTPGLGPVAVGLMSARRAGSHAAFFLPFLTPGQSVLDLGCGPGTITEGLAAAVAPGTVIGIDQGGEQLAVACQRARAARLDNLAYQSGSAYRLPLPDASIDRVFCHALLEHLAQPQLAIAEIRRVLRPGGIAGLCSPDWGGFILSPPSRELGQAIDSYTALQRANGGDPLIGRKLSTLLEAGGFTCVRADARYERYLDARAISHYLAAQLRTAGEPQAADVLEHWAASPSAMFAQTWVSVTGRCPG